MIHVGFSFQVRQLFLVSGNRGATLHVGGFLDGVTCLIYTDLNLSFFISYRLNGLNKNMMISLQKDQVQKYKSK